MINEKTVQTVPYSSCYNCTNHISHDQPVYKLSFGVFNSSGLQRNTTFKHIIAGVPRRVAEILFCEDCWVVLAGKAFCFEKEDLDIIPQ